MIDDDNLIVFNPKDQNFYDKLPASDSYIKVIGIDTGYHDADAIVVLYYSLNTGKIYLEEEIQEKKQTTTELFRKTEELYIKHDVSHVVYDSAAGGKKIVETYLAEGGIMPMLVADKTNKMDYVEILRSNIQRGDMMFKRGSELAQEMKQIIYNHDKSKLDDKQGIHSDLLDATLYSFRFIYNWIRTGAPKEKETFKDKRIRQIMRNTSLARREVEEKKLSEDKF